MTHRLTIVATYKAPPGHNRLTDVTLAVAATLTTDGTITTTEAEILRAACALIHVPLPALLT